MIDDRGKPPGRPGEGDEPVADVVTAARRRPTRKLRVPNDPVPRRVAEVEAAPAAPAAAPEAPAPVTLPLPRPSRSAIDTFPEEEESLDTPTEVSEDDVEIAPPSEPPAAIEVAPPPPRTPSLPARTRSVPPPPGTPAPSIPRPRGSVPPPPAKTPSVPPPPGFQVPRPASQPPPPNELAPEAPTPAPVVTSRARVSVPPPRPAPEQEDLDDHNDDYTDRTIPAMPVVRSTPPPAITEEPVLETRTSDAPAPARVSVPPADADGSVVIRQVRRKIRAVGTGSAPPPPKPAAYEDTPRPVILADLMPSVIVTDDDFAVPPVDASEATRTGGEALRAPAVPTFDAPPGSEAEVLDSADIALEEPESETLDEPTEEITIPSDLLEQDSQPPASLKGSIPDAPRKPPTPPKAPPKAPDAKPKQREETPPARRKRRPWWEEMFSDEYFRTMPKYTPAQIKSEADFIEQSLGVEKGAVVLDVACGDGRQAIELATRGYEMIALDLSLAMLSRAADSAQDREAKLNFLHSDMCEMEFNEMFDAAYCTTTSFGYFEDDKNADVAQRIHRALKTGGTLLLDVLNRDYAIQSQPSMTWFEADGCVCMEETIFDYIKSRLQVKRTMIMDDGRQKEFNADMRLYSLHELGQLLHHAGFRIVEVSGSYRTPGAFFGSASRQIVILAQKQKRADSQPADGGFGHMPTQPSLPVQTPPAKDKE